jgi:FkbM family methyltransferase
MSIVIDALSKLANDNSGSLKFLHEKVSNWHEVLLLLTGAKNSLKVKMKNGKSYNITVTDKYVVSDYRGALKLCYGTKAERIHAILTTINEFFDEGHKDLDVKGKDVVDIGAYIGDTPLYFAFNGAEHVYGLEPYPYSYKLAKKNVSANKLDRKITMINAGCGSRKGSIKIETEYDKSLAGSELRVSKSGKIIPIIPLSTIVNKYKLKNAVLKIDCEGCEYDIIVKSKNEALRKFSSILIEYHYGYPRLGKKLKAAGFKIKHIEAEHIMKNVNVKDQEMHAGTIVATILSKKMN